MEYPQLERAIEVIAKLRDPDGGCPWDLKQTHKSLLKYLVEESYEFLYAAENDDNKKMEEELGDVLLQILLHSQIASEEKRFDIESVAKTLADKMVYRHPHVFGDTKVSGSEEVLQNWEKLKKEKSESKYYISMEDTHMPSLMSAHKIGKKSKRVNFDWDDIQDVISKVEEEWQEVKDELVDIEKNQILIREEIGDLLFSVAQLSRHLGFDAEEVLRDANKKFINRFNKLEDAIQKEGKEMTEMSVPELEKVWQKIKKL